VEIGLALKRHGNYVIKESQGVDDVIHREAVEEEEVIPWG
jgi:hypothetical protein